MEFVRKYGFYFLLLGVMSDFLTPYILGFFYPKLDQMTDVISVFGDVDSPVRKAFLIWSVVSGMFFLFSLPTLYQIFSGISRPLASLLTAAIGFYGLGDCIFTGLFSINTNEATWNVSTWVHNIGSGLGYSGFLLFPVLLFLLYRKDGQYAFSQFYLILTVISLVFAVIYGLARIPSINQLPILNKIGFCQRISFFFNYVPIACLSIWQIRR
ncbi:MULTISPECIES: DUF998 domain-containing protein [unclassified Enterococcus]|uniref:DUF998 domain-containing protein n=1 Tax=unclassified Enterococcus TaxID=2608891 RepID=UPI0013ED6ACC|nr:MULTISPECIES: DUF998 domain-containing protein [unclassified Enterococcus]